MRNFPEYLRLVAYGALVAFVAIFWGCGKKPERIATGHQIPGYQLPYGGFHGDPNYVAVASSALPGIYEDFKQVLFDQGLTKWDSNYDCNHFAALYVALAQARYAVAEWHGATSPRTLALAELWYRPSGGTHGHAIVLAVTDQGPRFIEPQTGQLINLTAAEISSRYLVKW